MKRLLAIILPVLMLADLSGQNIDQSWSVGLFGGKTEYAGDLGSGFLDFSPFYGHGALQLNHYLSPSFDLTVQLSRGAYGYFESSDKNFLAKKSDGSLLLKYKLNNGYIFKEDVAVAPFLITGVGLAAFGGEATRTNVKGLDGFLSAGGGIRVILTPKVSFIYQLLYNFSSGDNRDLFAAPSGNDRFISHSIGLTFNFGTPKDSDRDGIPDRMDKCPDTPSMIWVTFDGCPVDSDNDGVPDYVDKCPSAAGIAAFSGCPDSDGDGIEDAVDDCPGIAGLPMLRGCPDADDDGVADSRDRCPDTPGLPDLDGCPDADGDGIIDAVDRCPEAKGMMKMNGCPDTDDDSIADIDDKCPLVAGIRENKGCPAVSEETRNILNKALTAILFETGKNVIRPSSYAVLNEIGMIMKRNPEYNLEIRGHTDSSGDDAANLDLSQRRAEAVMRYLSDRGVEAIRMTATGLGETMPVADNNTASGRARNRRVEFSVVF